MMNSKHPIMKPADLGDHPLGADFERLAQAGRDVVVREGAAAEQQVLGRVERVSPGRTDGARRQTGGCNHESPPSNIGVEHFFTLQRVNASMSGPCHGRARARWLML